MTAEPTVMFIIASDPLFRQAAELRHRVLYEPHGVADQLDFDDEAPGSVHAVVVEGTRVVGYGRLQRHVGETQIRHLCVDRTAQGGGLGTALLKALVDKARREGSRKVYLNARFTALGLYRRLGFVEVGSIFHTENVAVPHKRMELALG
jgi:ribosomal protein S18 acetylase RimI-like enzyme